MPYVIRWPHKRVVALVAACFGLLVVAHPAPASAATSACAITAASPVFAPLGDTANYSVVAGGTFEGDMTGWSLNGASVVPGNEPYFVNADGDSHSLSIAPGGTAISPPVCINNLFPTWRFFADTTNGPNSGALHVSAQVVDGFGWTRRMPLRDLNSRDFSSWQATSPLALGSLLPPGMNVTVRFVFSADQGGAPWSIDDVYIDPYAR